MIPNNADTVASFQESARAPQASLERAFENMEGFILGIAVRWRSAARAAGENEHLAELTIGLLREICSEDLSDVLRLIGPLNGQFQNGFRMV